MQSPSPVPTPAAADTGSSTNPAQVWGQCGGIQWQGPTQCVDGCVCEKQDDHYSQCLPSSSSNPTVSDPSQEGSAGQSPEDDDHDEDDDDEAEIIVTDGASSTSQAGAYGQCGGLDWAGPMQCIAGYTCERQDDHYSQCLPINSGASTSTSHAGAWGQCGGLGWEGPRQCIVGYTCERQNDHYSQCLPKTASLLGRKRAAGNVQQHLQK